MKFGRTIAFILLFVIATAVYIYQTRLDREVLTQVPDEVNRSVVISQDDAIDGVELLDHVRKTEISLEKEKGEWMLESPVHCLAENRVAEGLVIAARMIAKQPRLRAEKEWGEYGLAKPELEITFDLRKKNPLKLLIGSPTPIGKAVFAKWDDERGYFLLPVEMKQVYQQSVYGLRDKRIFRAPAETFRKISVAMGKDSYQWVKKDGEWYWFEPVEKFGQKVQAGSLDPLLAALKGLHVKEFLDNNKKSKADLGFFMIHDRIRVDLQGDEEAQTLCFGNEVPLQSAYYGLLEGTGTVFLVDRGKVIEILDLLKTFKTDEPGKTADEEELVSSPSTSHPRIS